MPRRAPETAIAGRRRTSLGGSIRRQHRSKTSTVGCALTSMHIRSWPSDSPQLRVSCSADYFRNYERKARRTEPILEPRGGCRRGLPPGRGCPSSPRRRPFSGGERANGDDLSSSAVDLESATKGAFKNTLDLPPSTGDIANTLRHLTGRSEPPEAGHPLPGPPERLWDCISVPLWTAADPYL